MEALLQRPGYYFGLHRNLSESAGSEGANVIEKALATFERSQESSIYFSGETYALLCELTALYRAAHAPDWEREESGCPSDRAYANARSFIVSLPQDWPKPILDVDRDGDFTFEWILAPKLRISLSIGEDAQIAYTWILQGERSYGVDFLGLDLPAGFETQAKRVIDAGRRVSAVRACA